MQTQPEKPMTTAPLIFTQMPKIMAEVGAIEKTRTNHQGSGYKFRGIDDIYAAMQGLLAKHKVFYTPTVLAEQREERQSKSGGNLIYTVLKMMFTFYAEDGSHVNAVTVGEAMDSGDKSANKAMSAALKYAILQVFCIPTQEDNDTENQTHEVAARPRGEDRTTGSQAPARGVQQAGPGPGARRPIGPPPAGARPATPPPATTNGRTAPKSASPSKPTAEDQADFNSFRG